MAWAAQGERYDYDGLGRLVRAVASDGVVTEYTYDGAGNITAVTRGAAAAPPSISSATPASVRRGTRTRITLSGSNLANVAVQADDRELAISGVTRSATALSFDLTVSALAVLGPSTLRVSSASGAATSSITIRPQLPRMELTPLPIAVPPDGRSASIDLVLSNADDEPHTVALSTARPDIAGVSPASLTIPAGSVRATLFVTGRAGGNTEVRLTSPTLGSTAYPVFVLAAFEGITTARALSVGVVKAVPVVPPTVSALFSAAPVGVVRSSLAWLNTSPRYVSQGGTQTLTITGTGLTADLTAAIEPSTGLTVASPVVAADGRTASVTVSAAAGAVQGLRRLALRQGSSTLSPAVAGADLIDVVAPLPEVHSVSPILLAPGSTVSAYEIRGRNLQDATAVQVVGGGVVVGNPFTVNADGTLLTVGLQVSPVAVPGTRTVVVVAPSGTSSTSATPHNTLTIIDEGGSLRPFSPITSPVVGVIKALPAGTGEATQAANAMPVGVVIGPIVVSMAPPTVARTESITLQLRGQGLSAVDTVAITPPTGLTVGLPTVSTDGTTVSVSVAANGDAPLGPRRVEALVAGRALRVAGNGSLQLLVTPLLPVVDSIDPISRVPDGQPFTMSVRGRNFTGATSLRFAPDTGISVGTVTVNAEGTILQAAVAIVPQAARGARVVTVVAPGGESTAVPGANNLFTVANSVANVGLPPVLVGVQVGNPAAQPPTVVGVVASAMVGVTKAVTVVPTQREQLVLASPAGVVRGPAVTVAEPDGWMPGTSGTLTVRGVQIPAGSTLRITPSDAATLSGTAEIEADGSAIRQTINITAGTTAKTLLVDVLRPASSSALPTIRPQPPTLWLYPGVPEVVSLEPILARQGDRVDLLVRGTGLAGAVRVVAEPAAGLEFAPDLTVNATGTELRIQMLVRDDAPLGARVIRVFNRLGGSAAIAAPANTFTVFPKE